MDATVTKISEVSNDVSKLLALHEERIETLYQNDRILEMKVEKGNLNFAGEIKDLHQHLRSNNRDFMDKIKDFEESIKNDIKAIKETIDKENKSIRDDIAETKAIIKENQTRITALEKWRWLVAGGWAVILWLLNKSGISFSVLL
jgi:uncharacterized phage infection (PIP) family protein YhgE